MLHVHVLLVAPLGAGHMPEPRADQYERRITIRKATHHAGTSADLSVEPFNDRRMQIWIFLQMGSAA